MAENNKRRGGVEGTDVNVVAVGKFAVALLLMTILAGLLLFGLFRYFQSQEGGQAKAIDPTKLFPQPQLQKTPAPDLQAVRAAEDQVLNTYGWVDPSKGVVRIPIARAMELLSERGLPARPEAPADLDHATVPTASGLGPIMQQPGGPLGGEMRNRQNRNGRGFTQIYADKNQIAYPLFHAIPWGKMPMVVLAMAASGAWAQPGQPAPAQQSYSLQDSHLRPALPGALQGVGIDQKLDEPVPLNLLFRDEAGRSVPLATYFQGRKPVILALVYYECPMLCTEILNGLESSLKAVSFNPGQDFEVVSVSFDPKDTPEIAAAKKELLLRRYKRKNTANGWHFLTGDAANIQALTSAVGFHYKYDPQTKQFAHASGIMILTPEGRLSRYFYGVEYAPRDVRLGLVEASQNHIGTPVDQILLFCYHYDPATGKYGAMVMKLVRFGGAGFVLVCGAFLWIAMRREKRGGWVRHGI